jgi:DNA repair protein RadB
MAILPTGSASIDTLLEGGLHAGEITAVYGEAATGKTTLAYQCLINMAKEGFKTVYIDTEHTFNTRRISQIDDKIDLSDYLIVLQPETFAQQVNYMKKLKHIAEGQPFKLLIIDTVSHLYRLELDSISKNIALRRLFEQHIARIHGETRRHDLFTLIISQVRSHRDKISPIGEDQIYAYSKKILELNKGMIDNKRNAILRKGISNLIDESLPYIITEKGLSSKI